MKKIVLASQSPRRKELLDKLHLDFNIVVSDIDEEKYTVKSPVAYVEKLAFEKANSVANLIKDDAIVIGCDTVVVYNNDIIEKPKDYEQAYKFLERLSGNNHTVYSGLVLIDNCNNKQFITHEETKVFMRKLTHDEIEAYISTKEPFDKAGAYGIQGIGSVLIEKIIGDYYNVMGLPINKLYKGLRELGVNYFDMIK